jgi:hypothetical protein
MSLYLTMLFEFAWLGLCIAEYKDEYKWWIRKDAEGSSFEQEFRNVNRFAATFCRFIELRITEIDQLVKRLAMDWTIDIWFPGIFLFITTSIAHPL